MPSLPLIINAIANTNTATAAAIAAADRSSVTSIPVSLLEITDSSAEGLSLEEVS